ncbi:cation/H(+) antiporter 18-like [Macadamia integrifolia]|uniref:cation/H(+) antiporter 18-like n=1 Tax=Macadamia integrifolia TaxID=60698 RepID=UPI001C4E33B1|nr:cation/H(+) antiporter 18-like [Macadamia integrifolia]XP_042505094.1 cation/H(+) antiporter 18-like [Macadamia integrifolia]XP_042505095.1 cation/H(+) antiporter 18-like [Macadamia integrifolia]
MASNATVCPAPMVATSNGVFQGNNPLDYALPLAILQICLVLTVTRILAYFLRPLRQPRVIAEIIGGVFLGPSALGRNKSYLHSVFPSRSLTVLDTLANLGLLFFLFLVGVELDPKSLRRTGKKALAIAVVGISFPFALGIGSSFVLKQSISKGVDGPPFLVFMGVALSITAFPVLARILAELKLLTTDVGRLAMSAAAVNDVVAWILLALAIALSTTGHSPLVPVWVLLSGCFFVTLASLVLPPVFKWMARRCPEGEPVDELYICATLALVLAAGFVTDAIGIHALFGAFVVGILVPKEGPFASALVEKVEDLVSGLLLPLYFVSSGLKTNVATIRGAQSWGLLVLVIVTACFGKIVGTIVVSLLCKIPCREALALGFLMNSKGLVELIVLNIGRDRKVLNEQTFSIMVLMALFTTFITTPLVVAVYKPARRANMGDYKHRTIDRRDPRTEFRVLACFHSSINIPTLINLIEVSRGTDREQGLCVYSMHLMELSERPSAILMVNKARKNGLPFWNKGRRQIDSDHVVVAFESFQQLSGVSMRPMTAISSMATIHEDICTSAEDKRVAMIILPFHKHQRVDGSMETTRNDFRWVNQRVLEHARCSVGILVDRGFGGTTHVSSREVSSSIIVLFFGGCDDREALAYGARMAEHPGINLTVYRFLMEPEPSQEIDRIENLGTGNRSIDDEYLAEFQQKTQTESSMKYEVRMVRNTAETIAMIRELSRSDLFLGGRKPEGEVAETLDVKSDFSELGPVGSLLASSDFSTTASVLIIQQYNKSLASSDSPVISI